MRYALISDIHANLEALQAVLSDITSEQCTHTACLGDIVGYNANPKECLDIIRSMNIPCVKGNHDEYCSSDGALKEMTPRAAKVINWTRGQLTADDKKWLSGMEYIRTIGGFTIVHATLNAPHRWGYTFEQHAAGASFACQTTPVCFFGHTHVPVAFIRDKVICGGAFTKIPVKSDRQYFVNVGSVGQPRDNDPKAAYVIYDVDEETIELRRVDYDIAAAQKKNADAGLL